MNRSHSLALLITTAIAAPLWAAACMDGLPPFPEASGSGVSNLAHEPVEAQLATEESPPPAAASEDGPAAPANADPANDVPSNEDLAAFIPPDTDGDGVIDVDDPCPTLPNAPAAVCALGCTEATETALLSPAQPQSAPSEAVVFEPFALLAHSTRYAPDDVVFFWNVYQPHGAPPPLVPDATYGWQNPTLTPSVTGLHHVTVYVLSIDSPSRCERATLEVNAVPARPVHIELTWETPQDLSPFDQGYGKGADLDVHLRGAGEVVSWFDLQMDVFWGNPAPVWPGGATPRLDMDDLDGAGPETISADAILGGAHSIGVHYWDDHGFGPSLARIRVLANGELVFDGLQWLIEGDLWTPLTLDSSGRAVSGSRCASSDRPCTWNGECSGWKCMPNILHDITARDGAPE